MLNLLLPVPRTWPIRRLVVKADVVAILSYQLLPRFRSLLFRYKPIVIPLHFFFP